MSRAIDLPVTPRYETWLVYTKRTRRALKRTKAKAVKKAAKRR